MSHTVNSPDTSYMPFKKTLGIISILLLAEIGVFLFSIITFLNSVSVGHNWFYILQDTYHADPLLFHLILAAGLLQTIAINIGVSVLAGGAWFISNVESPS